MNVLFQSHFMQKNQITLSDAGITLSLLIFAMFLLALFSLRKKIPQSVDQESMAANHFSFSTTNTLRGAAVIVLIIGHLSVKDIKGFTPYEYAGQWAVTVFLFISGIALTKRYGLKHLDKNFWIKRIERLIFPVWVTFMLFYFLDFFLVNRVYSPFKIILSFLGLTTHGPPNGPAWYISYILFFYTTFFIISFLKINNLAKFLLILFISYCSTYCIKFFNLEILGLWPQYTIIFPVSVFIGIYLEKTWNILNDFYHFSKTLYIISAIIFFMLYYEYPFISFIVDKKLFPSYILTFFESLRPFYLIICLLLVSFFLDSLKSESKFLQFLGNYSFELYLLHLPFLEYYDFFLFRKPFVLYFFIYALFILFLSFLLKTVASHLNRFFLKILNKDYPVFTQSV